MTNEELRELIKCELGDHDLGDPDRDSDALKSVLEVIRDHWSKPEEALGEIEFVIKVFGENIILGRN